MRSLIGAVAVALLLVPAAGSSSSTAKTIGSRGLVESISADGGRVAIQSAAGSCEYASVWTPSSSAIVRLPEGKCKDQSDLAFDALTIAGARVAWAEYDTGNHAYCYGPYTLVLGKKNPIDLEQCSGDEGETGEAWTFRGDGSLLVGAYLEYCDPCLDDEGNQDDDAAQPVTLYRVGSALTRLTRPRDGVTLLDVDNGRILAHEKDSLVVYSRTGRRGVAIKAEAEEGGITGADVVGVSGRALTVYDATHGARRTTRTLPAGSVLRDIDDGHAVYSVAGSIRLLRLSDGRDRFVTKVRELVAADLEPAGLFYAHNSGKRPKAGRVTFIPRAILPK